VNVNVDVGMVANVNTNVDTYLACSIILPIIATPSRTPRIGRNFWVRVFMKIIIVVDGHNAIIGEIFIPEKKKFSIVPASL
jgi:hypothetical protein